MTVDDLITDILRREGGYSDHKDDRGSATNRGITLQTLTEWRGVPTTRHHLKALTEAEARQIYRRVYLERPGLDAVPDEDLRALLVDFGVHSGPHTAVKALQRSIGVAPDGVIGPTTREALRTLDARAVYRQVLTARFGFIADLVVRDLSQAVFLRGWLARLCEFLR